MSPSRVGTVALVAGATLLSLTIALGTRSFIHPDEKLHVEAFRYFAVHAWPPDLDSDALVYDWYGTSKVYAREIVYVVLGRPGVLLERALGAGPPARPFRLLNVVLLPLALAALLRVRSRLVPAAALAVALAAIPQVLYVFGYANSDAWAVFVSVLLFVQALRLAEIPGPWPLREAAAFGLLAGLMLASKDNFLFALVLPAVVLAPRIRAAGRRGLLLIVLLAALVPAPYKVVYPMTQADFAGGQWRMAEHRARPGYKPSDPSRAALPPGDTAWNVLLRGNFLVRSAQSLWGAYGHMSVFNPPAVYLVVTGLVLFNVALTAAAAWQGWSALPTGLRALLLASPVVILANLAMSLRWSLDVYYQPQGRYLFPSLIPAALLLAGTWGREPWHRQRLASLGVALALAVWSLAFVALPGLSL